MARSKKSLISTGKDSHKLKHKPVNIPELERQQMISEAAYFIAEHRGFMPGDEMKDWLLAEQGISAKLTLKLE